MKNKITRQVRWLLAIFVVTLFLSGATAIPIDTELTLLLTFIPRHTWLGDWFQEVVTAFVKVKKEHSFLLYGYDWLAFAHFVLALLFIGPYHQPVQNILVIQFGMLAALLLIPFALVAGSFRGIPLWWRLVDGCFGVFGFLLLWICYRKIQVLMALPSSSHQ